MPVQMDLFPLFNFFSIFNVHFLHRLAICNCQKWTWKKCIYSNLKLIPFFWRKYLVILMSLAFHTHRKNESNESLTATYTFLVFFRSGQLFTPVEVSLHFKGTLWRMKILGLLCFFFFFFWNLLCVWKKKKEHGCFYNSIGCQL